jgi:hypothetical protein
MFKDAKIGDQFKTRKGWQGVYCGNQVLFKKHEKNRFVKL